MKLILVLASGLVGLVAYEVADFWGVAFYVIGVLVGAATAYVVSGDGN